MEAKKKIGFGKVIGALLSLVLLVALAAGIVSAYPRITEDAKDIYSEDFLNGGTAWAEEYFLRAYKLFPGMHMEYMKKVQNSGLNAGELVLGIMTAEQQDRYLASIKGVDEAYYSDCLDAYMDWYTTKKQQYNEWYATSYEEEIAALELEYYVSDARTLQGYGELDAEAALNRANGYPFVIQIFFDEKGVPQVLYCCVALGTQAPADGTGFDAQWLAELGYEEWLADTTYGVMAHGEGVLAGKTLTIASRSEYFFGGDNSFRGYHSSTFYQSFRAIEINYILIAGAALVLTAILALLLSLIKPLRLREGFLSNIPLELLIVLGILMAVVLMEGMPEMVLRTQMSVDYPGSVYEWYGVMNEIMAHGGEESLLLLVNGILWFAIFAAVFFGVISLLQVFYKGFFRYIKENTIIGRVVCFICRLGRKVIDRICEIDFKDSGNQKLLLAAVLHFILMFGICMVLLVGVAGWYFYRIEVIIIFGVIMSFLVMAAYSLLLFLFLQRKWGRIRTQYAVLLDTTEEMASGETEVTYNVDTGMFHELQEKLQRVQTGFHTAVQEEIKSQRMKSELITNVSHDLKTPLTAIITYVDLLKNEEISPEERRDYVQVLEQKSARLKTLIEDLFEVSKATSGNISIDAQELDLVKLLQEVQFNLEDRIAQSGIEFKLTVPEEKVLVKLDSQKTYRVFENLMVNITKYGLAGSRAFIQVENKLERVQVTLKNVSAAEITYASDEIMERFTRGDASRNTEGSGLGLAIVKSFVEAQGGRVELCLDDDLFKVTVSFPKTEEQLQSE